MAANILIAIAAGRTGRRGVTCSAATVPGRSTIVRYAGRIAADIPGCVRAA